MKRLLRKLPTFLFELIIVFIGVYAAFALNNWREQQAADKTRIKFYKGFIAELEDIKFQAMAVKNRLDTLQVSFDEKIAKGERPDLEPLPWLDFTINAFITKSAFSETHFENIDIPFLVSVSNGANLFDLIDKRVSMFHDSCRRQLYTSTPVFYDKNGRISAEFAWYFEDLRYIRTYLAHLIAAIEQGAVPETKMMIEKMKAN